MTTEQYDPGEVDRLRGWMAKWIGANWAWYAKFLSVPETSGTATRRPGPTIPTKLLRTVFPMLAKNGNASSIEFAIEIDSHGVREERVRCVPHIGRGLHGASRADMRFTNLSTSSPLLDDENAGAVVIFVFRRVPSTDAPKCRIWICRNGTEMDVANDALGPIEPDVPVPWEYL